MQWPGLSPMKLRDQGLAPEVRRCGGSPVAHCWLGGFRGRWSQDFESRKDRAVWQMVVYLLQSKCNQVAYHQRRRDFPNCARPQASDTYSVSPDWEEYNLAAQKPRPNSARRLTELTSEVTWLTVLGDECHVHFSLLESPGSNFNSVKCIFLAVEIFNQNCLTIG
jgi:hypothetical protein